MPIILVADGNNKLISNKVPSYKSTDPASVSKVRPLPLIKQKLEKCILAATG